MALSFFNLGAGGPVRHLTGGLPDAAVPWLLDFGGSNTSLFAVLAGFFLTAAITTWALPERRRESLEEPVAPSERRP